MASKRLAKAMSMIWLRSKYFEDMWDDFWDKMKLYEYLNENPKAA